MPYIEKQIRSGAILEIERFFLPVAITESGKKSGRFPVRSSKTQIEYGQKKSCGE